LAGALPIELSSGVMPVRVGLEPTTTCLVY